MIETLHIFFMALGDGAYEVRLRDSWSGKTVSGPFIPPYVGRQISALQKKLNVLDAPDHELREIGQRLYLALCGADRSGCFSSPMLAQGMQATLQAVIQRTLKRRGTVALTMSFDVQCNVFVRYPWELLHNGNHFLLLSGVFTLSRVLYRPDVPVGCELPVHPPFRILYISAAPSDCVPLETERSFQALEQAFTPLIDRGQVFLDRLEPPTFSQLVRYFSSYGGTVKFDDSEVAIPCYVLHFDGHGACGRLCPRDSCHIINDPEVRKCRQCSTSLSHVTPQTYLCFCNEDGSKHIVNTESLRDLLLSSDIRLAVFAACETAKISDTLVSAHRNVQTVVDVTLATALVTAQVPAVVAMPFSLQDDLSPTFMHHFYEALADGRTLEEAIARARQALLSAPQKSWFIPVLYRHVEDGEAFPVPLMMAEEDVDVHRHPLAHLGPATPFVGREKELRELEAVLLMMLGEPQGYPLTTQQKRNGLHRPHHIAITGIAGMGKSALACELTLRNRNKFQGRIIGISLANGKTFHDALLEIIEQLRLPIRNSSRLDMVARERLVLGILRSFASRELMSLLVVDGLEEVGDLQELTAWLHFLSGMPQEVVVLVTSYFNPEHMMQVGSVHSRWYQYSLVKMTEGDLLHLLSTLAYESGLDRRIHLHEASQQAILHEICLLLDGYPLGAKLIFCMSRSVGGKLLLPVAAARSLEEVRDDLREAPLAGMLVVFEEVYRRLSPTARLLLAYLALFDHPFSRQQISLFVSSAAAFQPNQQVALLNTFASSSWEQPLEEISLAGLMQNWRVARDELVQSSFLQFDGYVYTIHVQVRHFVLSLLPLEERQRLQQIIVNHVIGSAS